MKTTKNLILVLVILFPTLFFSQLNSNVLGLGLDMSSTGNGHGSFYIPSVSITSNRSTLSLGALVQKSTMQNSGYRLGYSINLSGDPSELLEGSNFDLLQINAYSYVQYNNPITLSHWTSTIENRITRESQVDWSKVKFATVEASMGLELRLNISSRLSWKNYIGMSYYNHVSGYGQVKPMYHEKQGMTLNLGTGIQFNFSK